MQCYRVEVPDGARVSGVTAAGFRSTVLPGEYLVHELPMKAQAVETLFRFVGADALGHDVHVPLRQFQAFLAGGTTRLVATDFAEAA